MLACAHSVAVAQDHQQYESELQNLVDEIQETRQSLFISPVGLGDRAKACAFKDTLEGMTENGEYWAFFDALKERKLMLTSNLQMLRL